MKRLISILAASLGALGMSGSANALSFSEMQGMTFDQYLDVMPTVTNRMLFSISGFNSSFDSLSFSFQGVDGLSVNATNASNPAVKLGTFNDFRNGAFELTAGTHYLVKISGVTTASIPGGVGSVSITALNAVVAMVPEPETYAMFLAGLGLIGGMAKRRKG